MMSTVDVSDQCRSSKKSTSGRSVVISRRNAESSRFIRSCDTVGDSVSRRSTEASIDVASWTYHDGAVAFSTRPSAGCALTRWSSASSHGR